MNTAQAIIDTTTHAVPAEQAFHTAYQLALEAVIEGIGGPASGPLGALLQEAQATLEELGDSSPTGT